MNAVTISIVLYTDALNLNFLSLLNYTFTEVGTGDPDVLISETSELSLRNCFKFTSSSLIALL